MTWLKGGYVTNQCMRVCAGVRVVCMKMFLCGDSLLIDNRLKWVGELTRTSLLVQRIHIYTTHIYQEILVFLHSCD